MLTGELAGKAADWTGGGAAGAFQDSRGQRRGTPLLQRSDEGKRAGKTAREKV